MIWVEKIENGFLVTKHSVFEDKTYFADIDKLLEYIRIQMKGKEE